VVCRKDIRSCVSADSLGAVFSEGKQCTLMFDSKPIDKLSIPKLPESFFVIRGNFVYPGSPILDLLSWISKIISYTYS
jgi:hypothetical protein